MTPERLAVTFFVGTLRGGGAERQVVLLARGLARRGHRVSVVTVFGGGLYWPTLANDPTVRLEALFAHHRPGPSAAGQWLWAAFRLRRHLQRHGTRVLYSFLYSCHPVAFAASWGRRRPARVWGLRASNQRLTWKVGLAFGLCRRLSAWTDLMIANSHAGTEHLCRLGFGGRSWTVIANGIDTDTFQRRAAAGADLRRAWGVRDDDVLIGLVARLHPMKDHPTFLRAAAALLPRLPRLALVCVGRGPEGYRRQLERLAEDLGLAARLRWAGERRDLPAVYSALDAACSSSARGEGFSNVIGEALACGVPLVVTDVGDAARIVGDTAAVVPPELPEALAAALATILGEAPEERRRRRSAGRRRMEERFSVAAAVTETEAALLRVAR